MLFRSNINRLFASVGKMASKVLMLSTGGIRSPPSAVDSLIRVQETKVKPETKERAINRIERKKKVLDMWSGRSRIGLSGKVAIEL